MKTKIVLELTHEEACDLVSYLPNASMIPDKQEETLEELKKQLCKILGIKFHDSYY